MASVIEHGDFTCYGGISVEGNGAATAIAVATTFVQFLLFDTDDPARGTTPAHAQDHIEITVPGTYLILFSCNVEVTNAEQVHAEVKLNNGTVDAHNVHDHTTGQGGGLKQSLNGQGIISGLAVGDTIELWVTNDSSTDNVTIEDATLSILRVGS